MQRNSGVRYGVSSPRDLHSGGIACVALLVGLLAFILSYQRYEFPRDRPDDPTVFFERLGRSMIAGSLVTILVAATVGGLVFAWLRRSKRPEEDDPPADAFDLLMEDRPEDRPAGTGGPVADKAGGTAEGHRSGR